MLKYFISVMLIFTGLYSDESFKINKVERDLINPKGTVELTSILSSTLKKDDNNDLHVNVSYAISNKLELVFLGVNYLFYDDVNNDYLAGVRFIGGRSGSGRNSSNAFEFKLKGKNRFLENKYALEYHALYTHIFNSSNRDDYMFEFLIEPIISINDHVSFSLSSRYIKGDERYYDIISNTKYYDVGCNLYVSVNKYIDLYVKYAYFENSNPSHPAFNSYDYDFYNKSGNRVGFGGSFRFFF